MNGEKNNEYRDSRLDEAIAESLKEMSALPDGFGDEVASRINAGGARRPKQIKEWRADFRFSPKIKYAALAAGLVAVLVISSSFLKHMGQYNSYSGDGIEVDRIVANGFAADGGLVASKSAETASESAPEYENSVGRGESGSVLGSDESENQNKIIENFWYGIKTEEFEAAKKAIEESARLSGGFIESMNTYGTGALKDPRTASFSVKIPVNGMAGFGAVLTEIGEVYRESKSAIDVTKHYREIEVEIANYEEAEKRYLALYEKAETIEDMLRIENELSRIRNYIDVRKAQIKSYDHQVAYATYSIELQEVIEEKPVVTAEPGTLEKAKYAFVSSLNSIIRFAQNTLIWLVSILPVAVIIIAVCCVLYFALRAIIRKALKNAENSKSEKKQVNISNEHTGE